MSILAIVRHGQASFGAADYDALSPLGEEQARLLGEHWAGRKLTLDGLYVGPAKRHRQTVAGMRAGAEAAGHPLPEAEPLPGIDEIDVSRLFDEAFARVLPSCPDFFDQWNAKQLDERGRAAYRHTIGVVSKLMLRWATGEEGFDDIEPYADFTRRVTDAIQGVMKRHGRGANVAIVTSAGPVSVAFRLAVGCDIGRAMGQMMTTNNASVTELWYSPDRLSLGRYNVVDHLPPQAVTKL